MRSVLIAAISLAAFEGISAAQTCVDYDVQFQSPSNGFAASAGTPVNLLVQITACGSNSPLTDGSVKAAFSNGDDSVQLQYQAASGLWAGTWTPVMPATVAYIDILVAAGGGPAAGQLAGSVGSPLPPFSLDKLEIQYSVPAGTGTAHQQVTVVNNTSQAQTVSVNTYGGSWLSVSPSNGTIPAGGSLPVQVAVNPASLAANSASGSLSVTAGKLSSPTTLVSVVVLPPTTPIQFTANAYSVAFAATTGDVPHNQVLTITNPNVAAVGFTVQVSGNWLSASPLSGTIAAGGSQNIQIVATPGPLGAGTYSGALSILPAGGQALSIPATLTLNPAVLPAPSPGANLTSVSLSSFPGGATTSAVINLSSTNGLSGQYSLVADAVPWLSVTPSSGALSPNSPAQVVVVANPATLSEGSYVAQIATYGFSPTGSQVAGPKITVTFLIVPVTTITLSNSIGPIFVQSPPIGSKVTVGQPVPVRVQLFPIQTGKQPQLTPQNTSVVFIPPNSAPSQTLTYTGSNLTWQGTWVPQGPLGIAQMMILVLVSGAGPSLLNAQLVFQVLVADAPPSVSPPSIAGLGHIGASSNMVFAPGEIVSVYGTGLSDCTSGASTIPLPVSMCGTQVLMGLGVLSGGSPLPLFYVSPNQVNVELPFGIATNTLQQLIVFRDGTLAIPTNLIVAATAPNILASGSNGVITNTAGALVSPSNPLHAGDVAVIYCSGLGEVSPPVALGLPAAGIAAAVNPVSLTFGGSSANILYAGLAPGFPGLYQINAKVPAGVTGDQVPVVVTQGGQSGSTVVTSIH
jgi:uncharacterized protein (TIGR03437 family)